MVRQAHHEVDATQPRNSASAGWQRLVLGVAKNHSVNSWRKANPIAGTAENVAQCLATSDWSRLSAGEGTKGPRLYDWAYVELASADY
jgi:SRSO17 transposase